MNRSLIYTLGLAFAGLLLCAPVGWAGPLPDALNRQLTAFGIAASNISVEVWELGNNRRVLSHNSEQPRNPASSIKVMTTLSALETLHPDYLWHTRYLLDGELENGVLNGNLVMVGEGDPFLTVDRLWQQLQALRQRGLHTITGDLIIDNTRYDLPPHDPAAFDGRPDRAYNVAPDAALVNFSATRFVIQPRPDGIHIFADPPLDGLTIENTVRPAAGRCRDKNAGWHYRIDQRQGELIADFSGTYRHQCGLHSLIRVLTSNPDYLWRLFRYLWTQNGGQLHGHYRIGTAPHSATELYTAESLPLADLVTGINKHSNNVMSRNLFLALDTGESPATLEGARDQLHHWLTAHGIPTAGLFVDNGSGLSRKTRVTGATLAALLAHGWHSNYRPEFLSSLPLSAMDGTMRKRLNGSALQGRARIKTGYLKGVRTMAGYVRAADGRDYSVVMLLESSAVNYSNGNQLQDALLQWIYEL